jgi:hypothetical protein
VTSKLALERVHPPMTDDEAAAAAAAGADVPKLRRTRSQSFSAAVAAANASSTVPPLNIGLTTRSVESEAKSSVDEQFAISPPLSARVTVASAVPSFTSSSPPSSTTTLESLVTKWEPTISAAGKTAASAIGNVAANAAAAVDAQLASYVLAASVQRKLCFVTWCY